MLKRAVVYAAFTLAAIALLAGVAPVPLLATGGGAIDYTGPASSGGGGSVNSVTPGDGLTNSGSASDPILNVGALAPLVANSNDVSMTYDGDKFTLNGSSQFDLRLPGNGTLREGSSGVESLFLTQDEGVAGGLSQTVNVSGSQASLSVASEVATLNVSPTTFTSSGGDYGSFPYVKLGSGFTVTTPQLGVIELNVPTPTSTVSTASPVSGDGSGGSPVTIANGAIALEKLVNISADSLIGNGLAIPGAPTELLIGTGLDAGAASIELDMPVQNETVSAGTADTLNVSGAIVGISVASEVATFNATPTTFADTSGSLYGSFPYVWVGGSGATVSTPMPDVISINVPGTVSVATPITGNGSAASPLDLSIGTGLEESGGSIRAALVIASPLTGTGGATALDIGIGTGLTDSAGNLTLNAVIQDEGGGAGNAHTVNVSSTMAAVTVASDVATLAITPPVAQDEGGNVNHFTTLNVSSSVAGATASGLVTTIGVEPLVVQDEGGNAGHAPTLNVSSAMAAATVSGGVGTLAVTPLTTQDEGGNVAHATTLNVSSAMADMTASGLTSTLGITPPVIQEDGGNEGHATVFNFSTNLDVAVSGGIATITNPGGGLAAATQAEMEAAASNAVAATPGRTQYHPGVAKFWVTADTSGVISSSYNVTSITDTGTGDLDITIATDFSVNSWHAHLAPRNTSANFMTLDAQSTGTGGVQNYNAAGTLEDPILYYVAGWGDQ